MIAEPKKVIGCFLAIASFVVILRSSFAGRVDELASFVGHAVLVVVYFLTMMLVIYWLLEPEDRWKWLREAEEVKAARLARRSRRYVTRQDLAEPSARADWNDDFDSGGDGD